MKIKQYDIWLANLGKSRTTDPGKIRPVVIVQTNLLNESGHVSTVICPVTTQLSPDSTIFRVGLRQLDRSSEIMVDQIRAIDNRMFVAPVGKLSAVQIRYLQAGLMILLDLKI